MLAWDHDILLPEKTKKDNNNKNSRQRDKKKRRPTCMHAATPEHGARRNISVWFRPQRAGLSEESGFTE